MKKNSFKILLVFLLTLFLLSCSKAFEENSDDVRIELSDDKSEISLILRNGAERTLKVSDFHENAGEFSNWILASEEILYLSVDSKDGDFTYLFYNIIDNEIVDEFQGFYDLYVCSDAELVFVPDDETVELGGEIYYFLTTENKTEKFTIDEYADISNEDVIIKNRELVLFSNVADEIALYHIGDGFEVIDTEALKIDDIYKDFRFSQDAEVKLGGDSAEIKVVLKLSASVVVGDGISGEYDFELYEKDEHLQANISSDYKEVSIANLLGETFNIAVDDIYDGQINLIISECEFFSDSILKLSLIKNSSTSAKDDSDGEIEGDGFDVYYDIDNKEVVYRSNEMSIGFNLGGGRAIYTSYRYSDRYINNADPKEEFALLVYVEDAKVATSEIDLNYNLQGDDIAILLEGRYIATINNEKLTVDIFKVTDEVILIDSYDISYLIDGYMGELLSVIYNLGFTYEYAPIIKLNEVREVYLG